jgi:hypothetical protein
LGTTADYLNIKADYGLLEKLHAAFKRLNQGYFQIWTGQCYDNPRQTSPRSDIKDGGTFCEKGGDWKAVKDVALPDAVSLTGAY